MGARSHIIQIVAGVVVLVMTVLPPLVLAAQSHRATIREADYATGYFGEALPNLTKVQQESYVAGYFLFLKNWKEGDGFARNASSCASCHNVPMPGGSGMSRQALIDIDKRFPPGSQQEVIQRGRPINVFPNVEKELLDNRRTPALFGLGYLEYAKTASLHGKQPRGRFGAFGQIGEIKTFVAQAFATELGVSSDLRCARRRVDLPYPKKCQAGLSERELEDVVSYLRFLAPPPHHPLPSSSDGAILFASLGCTSCHTRRQRTRMDAPEPFSSRAIDIYSDLISHDMGARAPVMTPPLWGLNSSGPPYMHNGCGTSINGAILCHKGEGALAANRYKNLPEIRQEELITYLKSL